MKPLRTFAIWLVLVVLFCAIAAIAGRDHAPRAVAPVATLIADIRAGHVREVTVDDDGVTVVTQVDGDRYRILGYIDEAGWEAVHQGGVPVSFDRGSGFQTTIVALIVALLLLVAVVVFLRRRQQQGGGPGGANIFALRRSTARLVKAGDEKLSFADVGGADEAKERLSDVVDYLKHPERWTSAGVRLPRGVLLEGPPGCGKTLLARAVAGEAGVPVHVVSASEFVEMFVGVGAARIRDLFDTAARSAPAVIFIDELDAVGRRRGSGVGGSHDEREQTLNQLLVSLDGFERQPRVVVIAATNRVDVLDRALLRPGRFDVRVTVPPPDEPARLATIRIHMRGKNLAEDVSFEEIAARTAGWSGADLEHLCNEAAMTAVRRARKDHPAGGATPLVLRADIDAFLAKSEVKERAFDRVDQLLLESASQLARPSGPTRVRLELLDGTALEGELAWADAMFVKVLDGTDNGRVLPKVQIRSLRALAGTGSVADGEELGDRWAGRTTDVA